MASTSSRWASAAGRPVACQYSSRLARPDRCGRKPGPSTNDPSRDRAGDPGCTRRPKIVIVPASGCSRPIRARSVVVFPAPFGPSSPSIWPRSTRSDRSSTASCPSRYRLVSPEISSGTPARPGTSSSRPRLRRSIRMSAAADQGGGGRGPDPPRRPGAGDGQRRVAGHREAGPGQRHPVDRGRRRGGVGEVGRGQHQPEPVARREAVVDRGQGDGDGPRSAGPDPAAPRSVGPDPAAPRSAGPDPAAHPQRRGQLVGQGRVAALVHVVDLGEQRHLARAADPDPHRGRPGDL